MKRFLILMLGVYMSVSNAKPAYYNELTAKVPNGIWTARCQTCHGGGSGRGLNEFGKDYFRLIRSTSFSHLPGLQQTVAERWTVLLNLDSDKDGLSNVDEILKGSNPGVR